VTPPVVLVTSRSFSSGSGDLIGELTAAGADVIHGPVDHDLPTLSSVLSRTTAWIAGTGPITRSHIVAAPNLRLIARYGVGVDAVDLDAAADLGVVVTNTPGANTDAVADHALALTLALLRHIVPANRDARAQRWRPRLGREVASLDIGVVGFGHIGRSFSARMLALGSTVSAYDPLLTARDLAAAGVKPTALADLSSCDVVSLHAPGGRVLIDADWLADVKPGLLLVNTARASLVDEAAIADALRRGALGGYAADDLGPDPTDSTHPVLADDLADIVVVTPHCAAQTEEAVDTMSTSVTRAVLAVLKAPA
jgi:D-3-phosphoglycerate dehydrogenase / 2-oxoglutarate reductase